MISARARTEKVNAQKKPDHPTVPEDKNTLQNNGDLSKGYKHQLEQTTGR
jgi:hypothetical protein